ncbi:coronin-2A-like [Fundulus diaphanus]
MSWRSPFRCSKFRHVFGKPATKEHSYDGVPISRSVHDNHYCSANPCFVAVVTECAGGGAFLVLPIRCMGRIDPQYPRVCGHRGRVLDVKWNPFDDYCIASCSEDCTVKIWDIPVCGVQQNITRAKKTLMGHSRRVAIIEWHPTAENLLLSSGYDYKVLLWDVSQVGTVVRRPVRVVLMPIHHRYPSEALLLSVSFNNDGSRLAVTSKDRRIRVLEPRTGNILQVSSNKTHRANKVLYIRGLKMLLSTGSSPWNHRQIVLWDPDDLSEPLYEEDLDGSAGVLFPFYDADTQMLYLAGKGDGNIRYYELSAEKPYISFLIEYRSLLPQKGLGVMPKRGLDVNVCEIFRFYRLIAIKDLVEPLSMIVPRKQSGIFQEDLYPMTAGNQAALTAQEWLMGINRGPLLMSLRPEAHVENPYADIPADKRALRQLSSLRFQMGPADGAATNTNLHFVEKAFLEEQLAYQDAKYPRDLDDLSAWQPDETECPLWSYCCTPHCCEPAEKPPPMTERELLQVFYKQQDDIRGLREELHQKDARIAQLELEIKNRSTTRPTF